MANPTAKPPGYKPGDVKVFTNPEAFRSYLQQRKIVVHASVHQDIGTGSTSSSQENSGNIRKCKRAKNYMNRFQPLPNMTPPSEEQTYLRLGALQPIPNRLPVDAIETCSNNAQAGTHTKNIIETCSNKVRTNVCTQSDSTTELPEDLEYVQLQPLGDLVTIEHTPIGVRPDSSGRSPFHIRSPTRNLGVILPAVLEAPQDQPHDYSRQYHLPDDFNCDLSAEEIDVATDFFSPQQDEMVLTVDDVMTSILAEMNGLVNEIRKLLLEPRTQEIVQRINNLMIRQQLATGALQRILSTYPVRQSRHEVDPMMNS